MIVSHRGELDAYRAGAYQGVVERHGDGGAAGTAAVGNLSRVRSPRLEHVKRRATEKLRADE